jgi:glucosyl-3-phosphoglycerate synthase
MDFYQQGPVALHDFQRDRGELRRRVAEAAASRPAALVLPMLYSEMRRPAIRGIRDGLSKLDYLHELIVPVTADEAHEVEEVRTFFDEVPMPVHVLWCEGPHVTEVLERLAGEGLDLRGFRGKGLAVWLGFGAAQADNAALAVHDADIDAYDPRIVDRLLFPILSDELDFFFAKGYYARLTDDQLYGRVVRLFVWPFLDALQRVLPQPSEFLSHLRAYRYPLSGEMAMTSDLARNLRMPTDWGLELGLLGEVYRNTSYKRICQVDLGLYSHKHKSVGGSPGEGLQRMVTEVATTILRLLAFNEGVTLPADTLTTLRACYRREAQDAIRRYHADSLVNTLRYERHEEEMVAERFENLIGEAGRVFAESPLREQISEWLRTMSAWHDAPMMLRQASLTGAHRQRLRDAAAADTQR